MPDYFRFRVQLLDVKPPIWREFFLRSSATFLDLHDAIQDASGWQDYHLFQFHRLKRSSVIAGVPDDGGFDKPDPDAAEISLSAYFNEKRRRCLYEYEFGDDWWHEVKLVETVPLDERFERRLLGGERAFPPEDCGSVPGYEACVELLARKGGRKLTAARVDRRLAARGVRPREGAAAVRSLRGHAVAPRATHGRAGLVPPTVSTATRKSSTPKCV